MRRNYTCHHIHHVVQIAEKDLSYFQTPWSAPWTACFPTSIYPDQIAGRPLILHENAEGEEDHVSKALTIPQAIAAAAATVRNQAIR